MQPAFPAEAIRTADVRHYRMTSIDLLRGIVMIIMALDHTRDFFHYSALTNDPLDLATTMPMLYVTRWVTHICAPTFIFLSGASAYLQGLRKSKPVLSRFLISRGLWLIFVEVVVVNFGVSFDVTWSTVTLQVIWAIGISMVILGLMVRLPFTVIFITGAAIVLGHNMLDYWEASHPPPHSIWYSLLHFQSTYAFTSRFQLLIFYPFLPWAGVMMMGYCFGKAYQARGELRHGFALRTGILLLISFVILRSLNAYGDPFHWSYQRSALYTFFSFMNVQKYPPSLLYLCATLGIGLTLLGLLRDQRGRIANIIIVYGRVPFFYYILHFYLLHLISATFFLLRGHTFAEGLQGIPGVPFRFMVPGEGIGLRGVYLVWIAVVTSLYPACRWYNRYKQTHHNKWLSYL